MTEIHWLAATALITSLFWIPYIINRLAVYGIPKALGFGDQTNFPPIPKWAERAIAAHKNAVENLVVFAPLVLSITILDLSNETTIFAASIYFFARLAHFVLYTLGVPLARTITYAIGWLVNIFYALLILGVI